MPEHAPRLEIDCSRSAPPDPDLVERIEQEALGLLRAGETEKAANVMTAVEGMRDEIAQGPNWQEVELTDEEIARLEEPYVPHPVLGHG